MSRTKFSHQWEDVSYHGSPSYECRFCGIGLVRDGEYKIKIGNCDEFCPKAEEKLKIEQEKFDMEEKVEYCRMKGQIHRFVYLFNKYGSIKDFIK